MAFGLVASRRRRVGGHAWAGIRPRWSCVAGIRLRCFAVLAALLGVASAGTACCALSLKSSVPAEGAQLSAGPPEVVLTFNER